MRRIALISFTVIALLDPAIAADDGCQKFAWSLASEKVWFAASDKLIVAPGDSLATVPKGAFPLNLQPAGEVSFALPPERKPRLDRWFGGMVRLLPPRRSRGRRQS